MMIIDDNYHHHDSSPLCFSLAYSFLYHTSIPALSQVWRKRRRRRRKRG